MKKEQISLFQMAFLQTLFVTVCTACIAEQMVLGAFVASFGINWLWTANVKRAAFGGKKDRLIYAFGASCGTATGLLLTMLVAYLRA